MGEQPIDFIQKLKQQQLAKAEGSKSIITQDDVISELANLAFYAEKESVRVKALDTLARHFSDNLKQDAKDTTREIVVSFKSPAKPEEQKLLNG